jgi:S1-C subfamily serine protease
MGLVLKRSSRLIGLKMKNQRTLFTIATLLTMWSVASSQGPLISFHPPCLGPVQLFARLDHAVTPVEVTIKVAVLSGLDVKPVALRKFIVSSTAEEVSVRTNEQGVITLALEPGKYKLRSVEPLNLGTTTVEWDYSFDVEDGKPLNLVVTNEDGITKKVESVTAPSGGIAPETVLYRKYKNSVATILTESGHGSGFLIDANGFFLTNAHVVEGTKKIRIKLGPGKVYSADVIQLRPTLDIAIVRLNPEVVKGIPVVPLLGPGDKQPEEGEKVIAMGSPLSQQTVMTSGIVSKVEGEVLISDVNINRGNSGGPLFDAQGLAIGICTFGDFDSLGGPGISGIVSIKAAKEIVDDTLSNLAAFRLPSAEEMPDFLEIKFQPTSIDPSTLKRPIPAVELGFPRLFKTYFDTEIWKLSRQLDAAKKRTRKTRRGKESLPESTYKFWEQYAGGKNYTLVTIQATPVMTEAAGSGISRFIFGGKAKMEVRFDFRDMQLYADGKLIEPVEFYRSRYAIDFETDDSYASDSASVGIFTYRFDAFDPGKKYTLRIRKEEDPDKWDETKLDPKLIKKIYDSFADVRKFLSCGTGTP